MNETLSRGLKLLKALAPFQFFSYIYNIQLITRYFSRSFLTPWKSPP